LNLESVHIVPTYACNLACSYCYASKYRGKFPQMSWSKFRKTLDWLVAQGVRKIIFIGGEPTVWQHIDKAIGSSQSLGMQVGLLSNGVKLPKVWPHTVMINGTNLTDPKLCSGILKNIAKYREHKVPVGIRFNLGEKDSPARLHRYANWAKKYASSVSFSPTVPYLLDKKLGEVLFDFAKLVISNKQGITLNRAVPLCIFTEKQLKFLRKNCGLYSRCEPAKRSVVINPDGSFLPCVDLNLSKKIHTNFKNQIAQLHKTSLQIVCESCEHFPRKCQGGCLSMKIKK
jgi:radical SAM protein with 4Fe4S-binding SPASM domain